MVSPWRWERKKYRWALMSDYKKVLCHHTRIVPIILTDFHCLPRFLWENNFIQVNSLDVKAQLGNTSTLQSFTTTTHKGYSEFDQKVSFDKSMWLIDADRTPVPDELTKWGVLSRDNQRGGGVCSSTISTFQSAQIDHVQPRFHDNLWACVPVSLKTLCAWTGFCQLLHFLLLKG